MGCNARWFREVQIKNITRRNTISILTGQVEAVSNKPGQYGPMISYKVNGDWFMLKGAKFPARGVGEGSFVRLEYEVTDKGYKNIVKGGLTLDDDAPSTSQAPVATGPVARDAGVTAGGVPRTGPYDARQDVISKQAAFNTGLQFVNAAQAAGALPDFSKAKQADKLSLFKEIVMKEAGYFYNVATGNELVYPEPELTAKPAPKGKAAEPVDEYDEPAFG